MSAGNCPQCGRLWQFHGTACQPEHSGIYIKSTPEWPDVIGSGGDPAVRIRRLEWELTEVTKLNTGHAIAFLDSRRELTALRAAVEKLAGEWEEPLESTPVGNTSHAYARKLRALLK